MKLEIRDVRPGDLVVLRDRQKNFVEGEASHNNGLWTIRAFNTDIPFAKDGANGFGARMIVGVSLAGHTPQLINESDE